MQLNKNTILITGGNSGIGYSMAKKFIELDNTVIITARNANRLKAAQESLPGIHTIQCDLTNNADMDKLVHYVEQKHPELNILINNAGIQYNYDFTKETGVLNKVTHEINTNMLATIQLITLLLPILEQNKNAAIVNVSSSLGLFPKRSAPVYCGTKAGVHIFTKALRYQLTGTKVFEVLPSLVDTNMTKGRGNGKISPQQLVDEFIDGFRNDRYEINIGKVKLLRKIARFSPRLADKIVMNK